MGGILIHIYAISSKAILDIDLEFLPNQHQKHYNMRAPSSTVLRRKIYVHCDRKVTP
jgi:hypothetical protein